MTSTTHQLVVFKMKQTRNYKAYITKTRYSNFFVYNVFPFYEFRFSHLTGANLQSYFSCFYFCDISLDLPHVTLNYTHECLYAWLPTRTLPGLVIGVSPTQ